MRLVASLIAVGFLGATMAAGIFWNQNLLFVAFLGLMVFMHLFGHGSHGGGTSHEDHSDHGKEAS